MKDQNGKLPAAIEAGSGGTHPNPRTREAEADGCLLVPGHTEIHKIGQSKREAAHEKDHTPLISALGR